MLKSFNLLSISCFEAFPNVFGGREGSINCGWLCSSYVENNWVQKRKTISRNFTYWWKATNSL